MTKFEQSLGYKLEPKHKVFQKQIRKLSDEKLIMKALVHILTGTGIPKELTAKIILVDEMHKRSK